MLNIRSEKLFDDVDKSKLVCFGAGKNLIHLIKHFDIDQPIVIDNYKTGKMYIEDKIVNILSLEQFLKKNIRDFILVITVWEFEDIVNQLDEYPQFDGVECYIYSFIKNRPINHEIILKEGNAIIPKVINYCWFGNQDLPTKALKCIDSWRKFCPDYEIKRWDESNYDVEKSVYLKQAYGAEKWAFVSDYARLDILYHNGGIYLDTDVELIKPIDDLLTYDLYCGFESDDYVAFGLGVGCVPKHYIIKEMLDEYQNTSFIRSDGTLNLKTCPMYQSEILKRHDIEMNGKFQEKDGIIVLPREFFCPYYALAGLGEITNNTRSIHWYSSSWETEEYLAQKERRELAIKNIRTRIKNG